MSNPRPPPPQPGDAPAEPSKPPAGDPKPKEPPGGDPPPKPGEPGEIPPVIIDPKTPGMPPGVEADERGSAVVARLRG